MLGADFMSYVGGELSDIKILVIDDDDLVRMTARNILQKAGCVVFEATSGLTGVKLFKSESPSVVITDMLMPDKEGLETITEIRSLNPETKIIAMSGGGSSKNMAYLQMAQKVGADHSIKKPFKPDELLSAIKIVLVAK